MPTNIEFDELMHLSPDQLKAVGLLTAYSKQMVVMAFLESNTPAGLTSMVKEIYQVFDNAVDRNLENATQPSCKEGCYWCCYLRVKVTPLEILCIDDFLHTSVTPAERDALRYRIVKADKVTRGLDGGQRMRAKIICPLAVDGSCLVYPVRPFACRMYHSLSASDCIRSLDDGDQSLRVNHGISSIGTTMFAGLTEGLREAGLKSRLLELIAGLWVAMDDPGSIGNWLDGTLTFKDAEIESAVQTEMYHKNLVGVLTEPSL